MAYIYKHVECLTLNKKILNCLFTGKQEGIKMTKENKCARLCSTALHPCRNQYYRLAKTQQRFPIWSQAYKTH